MPLTTEEVVLNHFQAANKGVDAVMVDFSEDSVLITHDATYRGMAEIRQFFTALLDGLPESFFENFIMLRQEVVGELAYTLWESKPLIAMATDSFIVRDGKIIHQTFTAFNPNGE